MPDTKEARKKVEKVLNLLLKDRGQQLASIGTGTDTDKLPAFNAETGSWENRGLSSKPARYLLQLRLKNGKPEVGNFIPNNLQGKLGALNGIMRNFRGVPGALVRLHLVIVNPDNTCELFTDWEWLVLILFARSVVGATSSDAITNFLPPKPSVTFLGKEVPVAAVQLFGLLAEEEAVDLEESGTAGKVVTYSEVSAAIQEYLSFDYTDTSAA